MPSTDEKTPKLRCPQCITKFTIPIAKLGSLARCKKCNCKFRVSQTKPGVFSIQEVSAVGSDSGDSDPAMNPMEPTRIERGGPPPRRMPVELDPVEEEDYEHNRSGGGGLKTILIALIVLVVLGGVGVGGYFGYKSWKGNDEIDGVSIGKFGGIEISSSGVKMIAIEFFKKDGTKRMLLLDPISEGDGVKLDNPRDKTTDFTDLPRGTTAYDEQKYSDTLKFVVQYFKALKEEYGITEDNISIVCSSAAYVNFAKSSIDENKKRLSEDIKEKTGRNTVFIEAEEEVKLSCIAIVEPKFQDQSVILDIGKKNGKGGGFDANGSFLQFDATGLIPEKNVKLSKSEWFSRLNAEKEKTLYPELRSKLDGTNKELLKRKKIYLLGGAPWAMSTLTRPVEYFRRPQSDDEKYYVRTLDAKVFDDFVVNMKLKTKDAITKWANDRLDGARKSDEDDDWIKTANNEVKKVQEVVFSKEEQLVAAALTLQTYDEVFSISKDKKDVYSFRLGHVAWLIGYLKKHSGSAK